MVECFNNKTKQLNSMKLETLEVGTRLVVVKDIYYVSDGRSLDGELLTKEELFDQMPHFCTSLRCQCINCGFCLYVHALQQAAHSDPMHTPRNLPSQ